MERTWILKKEATEQLDEIEHFLHECQNTDFDFNILTLRKFIKQAPHMTCFEEEALIIEKLKEHFKDKIDKYEIQDIYIKSSAKEYHVTVICKNYVQYVSEVFHELAVIDNVFYDEIDGALFEYHVDNGVCIDVEGYTALNIREQV